MFGALKKLFGLYEKDSYKIKTLEDGSQIVSKKLNPKCIVEFELEQKTGKMWEHNHILKKNSKIKISKNNGDITELWLDKPIGIVNPTIDDYLNNRNYYREDNGPTQVKHRRNGIIKEYWFLHKHGNYMRFDDLPSYIIKTPGKTRKEYWYQGDKILVRDSGGPTLVEIYSNGMINQHWLYGKNLEYLRLYDLPSFITTYPDGTVVQRWLHQNYKYYRNNDGPTRITLYKNGASCQEWVIEENIHYRENNLPTIINIEVDIENSEKSSVVSDYEDDFDKIEIFSKFVDEPIKIQARSQILEADVNEEIATNTKREGIVSITEEILSGALVSYKHNEHQNKFCRTDIEQSNILEVTDALAESVTTEKRSNTVLEDDNVSQELSSEPVTETSILEATKKQSNIFIEEADNVSQELSSNSIKEESILDAIKKQSKPVLEDDNVSKEV